MNSYLILYFFVLMNLFVSLMNLNNWITLWVNADLIFFSMMIILIKKNNNYELNTKFMIINVSATMILIYLVMTLFNSSMMSLNKVLMILTLWIKNNLFPFTIWMLFICKMNSWNLFFMLSLLMKLPYMVMTLYMINLIMIKMMIFIIIIPLINFNVINMKKSLFILSTNNFLWFILMMMFNSILWNMVLITYLFMNWMMFNLMNKFKINFLNQSNLMKHNYKLILVLMLLNIMNLPPLSLFMFKWMIIKIIFMNKMMTMVFMFNNIFSFALYLKLFINYLNNFNKQIKWMKNFKLKSINMYVYIFSPMFTMLMI